MDDEKYQKYYNLVSKSSDPLYSESLGLNLNDLGCIVNNFENFLTSNSDGCTSRSHIVSRVVESIVRFGLVPESKHDLERDYDYTDFAKIPENGAIAFQCLKLLLKEVPQLDNFSKCRFLTYAVLLCATHNRNYLWSSEESMALSKEFLNEVLKCAKYTNLASLLCDESLCPTVFKSILTVMRPSLMKETWMKTASSCHIFHWILCHVKHPHLSKYLPDVFPPPFMFISYHAIHQQVIGLRCFDHILDNVPPTLIKMNGKEDAIYHAVSPLIYSKELPIIHVLYPCLLKLPMMRQQKLNRTLWVQYDHVLHNILLNLEIESNVKLRTAFLSHVYSFIESVPPFKHLKRIVSVLDRNLSISDGPEELCRILSLKILKMVIKLCWPRMEYYCLEILEVILKLIYDLEEREEALHDYACEELYKWCEECLFLLRNACFEKFASLANSYVDEEDSRPGSKLLRSTLVRDS